MFCKSSINPITNPNPIYSHSIYILNVLLWNLDRGDHLGSSRHTWDARIIIHLKKIGSEGLDWMRWMGHVAHMKDMRNAASCEHNKLITTGFLDFVHRPEFYRILVMSVTHHRQNPVEFTIINLSVPQEAGRFLTIWATISFSRRTLLHEVNLLVKPKGMRPLGMGRQY
jgi:hypothetical protein